MCGECNNINILKHNSREGERERDRERRYKKEK
jgi:hypothetical protein